MTTKEKTNEAFKLKALVHRLAPKMVQDQVAAYIRLLKEGECGEELEQDTCTCTWELLRGKSQQSSIHS